MPIYEYRCQSCGQYHEALQRLRDEPLVECPQCQQPSLAKCISAPNFHLKGTGWYATDFKDNGQKASAQQGTANSDNSTNNQSDNSQSQGSSDAGSNQKAASSAQE